MKGHYNNVCLSEYMAWKKKAKKETKIAKVGAESGSAPPSEGEEEAESS